MANCAEFEIPAGLQEVAQQFEQWRSSHSGRRPIPEALWQRAADLAREHGVFRTACFGWIQQTEAADDAGTSGGKGSVRRPPPAFVEFLAPQTTAAANA